ncbi:MAG: DUF4230 domain-containing protein [Anaerolineales bacterium]
MKKWHIGIMVVLLVAAGTAGVALAQGNSPDHLLFEGEDPPADWSGRRMPHRRGGGIGQEGPLHDLMIGAMAEALGLPATELEERLGDGERLSAIAQDQGLDADAFCQLMQQIRQQVMEEAIAQGLVPQVQADRMWGRMPDGGFGGRGPSRGSRGRLGLDGERGEVVPLHDAMMGALAEALGLSVDELQQQLDDGATIRQIIEQQGLDPEVLHTSFQEAREQAIAEALEEGLITQEQAERMLERKPPHRPRGDCPMDE